MKDQLTPGAGALVGSIVAIGLAAALVGVRDGMGNTNVALVLVLVVVGAAYVGGRGAGAATSLMAAISFNFFHTEPYRSLRIDDRIDIITVVLLLVVGLVVGELASRRQASAAVASDRLDAITSLHRVGELVSAGAPVADVVEAVEREVTGALDLQACRYEPAPSGPPLPTLRHNGTLDIHTHRWAGTDFALPPEGAEIAVRAGDEPLGRLVLEPRPGVGAPREERLLAVALADQIAVAVAREHRP